MKTRSEAQKAAREKKAAEVVSEMDQSIAVSVKEYGRDLADEIAKQTQKDMENALSGKKSPFDFESANKARKTHLRPDMQKIVETVFINDIFPIWEKLRKDLHVGEKRSEFPIMYKALDQAEINAHIAHRLFITAKTEFEKWERDNEVIFSAMRTEATASLQREKDSGVRSKQITDADVLSRMASLHPDEFQSQEHERAKIKATVDSLFDLVTNWQSRCRSLQTMVSKMR